MKPLFLHIEPLGKEVTFSDFVKAASRDSHRNREITLMMMGLSETAMAFYRGEYPTRLPHFTDEFLELPWRKDYTTENYDEGFKRVVLHPLELNREELLKILAAIHLLDSTCELDDFGNLHAIEIDWWRDKEEDDDVPPDIYVRSKFLITLETLKAQGLDFRTNDKLLTQCLAIEALRCADHFFESLRRGSINDSVFWTCISHKAIIYLVQFAHRILGNVAISEQARKNALLRHRENHEMQEQAISYYRENQHTFKNVDEAASEIAGKIVPVKRRTVYEWILAYLRKLRSAGTA